MKRQSAHLFVAVILALLGPLTQNGRGDFVLYNNEQLTVNSLHNQGNLYDTSCAFIIDGGGGTDFFAHDFSVVKISGGFVYLLVGYDSSTLDISGGMILYISTDKTSMVDITGGNVDWLQATDSVTVDISGGSFNSLRAYKSSTVNFYGQNFSVSNGLILDGERVLGTGTLSGEWMDGTPWAINIYRNDPTATILATPVPGAVVLGMLGLSVAGLKLRKRREL